MMSQDLAIYGNDPKIYSPKDIDIIIKDIQPQFTRRNNKRIAYLNLPIAFDIETTSFLNELKEKTAIMYAWTLCINGKSIIGRTWEEFFYCEKKLIQHFNIGVEEVKLKHRKDNKIEIKENKNVMLIYIHNLAYEFQFLRERQEWDYVFASENRKPLFARTKEGIEYRCSYQLSGYSLEKLGENLNKYKVKKLFGDLDYSLMRHNKTPLSDKELGYIQHDGQVVTSYIQEEIERLGSISKLPLTKTGYVRTLCRNNCFYVSNNHKVGFYKFRNYNKIMQSLKINSLNEYHLLQRAFQGGFTHANALRVGIENHAVTSFDFTSSYPAVMVMEKFPMSTGKLVYPKSKEEFKEYLKKYCCVFDIEFINIKASQFTDHPLSFSKCWVCENKILDNGRVVEASKVITSITNIDFEILEKFYSWDKFSVRNFYIYKKGYLPTDLVKTILELYQKKTSLKGIEDHIVEYMKSKEMLNSCYGMTVTNIIRQIFKYENGEWINQSPNEEKELEKYNNKKTRFLFYPWGIFVTAYARRNLFTAINECKNDYIYSDTDSVKIVNVNLHLEYFRKYNNMVKNKLLKAMDYHGLDHNLVHPKTIKGVEKWLGVWDFDGQYKTFKTLGAKRYMVRKWDNTLSFTISGVNKKYGIPYLEQNFKDPFKVFKNSMYFPSTFITKKDIKFSDSERYNKGDEISGTGKNLHTYIDERREGILIDYLGNKNEYHELSAIHMQPIDYSLSLSNLFINYLAGVRREKLYEKR